MFKVPMSEPPLESVPNSDLESSGSVFKPELPFTLQKRWEVVGLIGQGGMGTVFMAKDQRLANRQCVVKKLRDDFFRQEDKEQALSFFQREAIVLSRLQHPNIVHILDAFQEGDDYYLVMEYVEGEDLNQMLFKRGEPFAETQVVEWAKQIADVLKYLHSHEPPVIYRDLKPSNVMIDTKDQVKLVDFGIARPYADDSENTHVISAGFSPPEQYWGAADPRSDIYALGATMHFLLTGKEPLALQTSSPKKLNPQISDHLDLVVKRATAQDVWLRYQNAQEIREDLEEQRRKEYNGPKPLEIAVGVFFVAVAALALLAFFKLSDSANQANPNGGFKKQTAKLENGPATQFAQLKEKTAEQLTDLNKLRAYAHDDTSKPLFNNSPQQDISAQKSIEGASAPVPYREINEAQLTDPEGLQPIETMHGQLGTSANGQ